MNYPLDKTEFIAWVKRQGPDKLIDLKLDLLASQADLQIQLQNYAGVNNNWTQRAKTKLRLTEWRLEVVNLLSGRSSLLFQQVARQLLDQDTYETILEAAQSGALNATRVS